jgi:hypothetical protein
MGVRTLHVTGLRLSGFAVDAAGRLQISTFGDDRSWKATLRVLAMPELGSRLAVESVVITTTEGATLTGPATFVPIAQPRLEGRLWLSAMSAGAFEVVG